MKTEPTRWQRDRYRELDAIDAKVAELPPILRFTVSQLAARRREDVNSLADRRPVAGEPHNRVAKKVAALAAELDRIKVETETT